MCVKRLKAQSTGYIIMTKSLFFLGLVGSLVVLNVQAEMYKWVDEAGVVQYSQSPPPVGVEGAPVKLPPLQTIDTPDSPEKSPEAAATTEPAEVSVEEQCKKAADQIKMLESGQELMVPAEDKPGEYVKLTDDMRQQKMTELQSYIERHCTEKPAE